ncbi:methyltransferase FkbM family [Stanieria cyanosphaera PCC 7437]|uniref:Methyltransferase FkbM family n=1 Tax=Stanieria cyanosphaera (strain ATCC 29371 / PCC 7437) TaxID=111780 RepID=K9XQK9_STAC7|nr:FkbM family methyltransferase [Stanieria cyanosphaera]AFZ34374.1 methyltransferase FkbM family [Stanieria cyanosphaera PCC 7437]
MVFINTNQKKELVSIRGHHFYTRFINENSNIIDLGSHLGQFSEQVSKKFKCKCFAVEAFPDLFKKIKETELIKKFNYAISISDEPVSFNISDNLEANHISKFSSNNTQTIVVQGITFENFIKKYNIKYIDLLKVDIEGAEIDLFNSISDESLKKIKQITIEFHDFVFPIEKEVNLIIKRLSVLGFYPINFSLRTKEDFLFINRKLCKFSFFDFLFTKYILKNREGVIRIFKRLFKSNR